MDHWMPTKIFILSSIILSKRTLIFFLHGNVPMRKITFPSLPWERSNHVTNCGQCYIGRSSWDGFPLKLFKRRPFKSTLYKGSSQDN